MESTDSSTGAGGSGGGGGGGGPACSRQPNLPPGFRFHPTDEELVVHYLKKKASSAPLPVAIIAEVDLYKFDPWELPAKAAFGEQEWYFFSPRDRKYPNGARPNRAATSGYWKATGTDKPVLTSGGTQKVGVKKALVFYGGKPPKGIKTNWIMHEYRLAENKANNKPPGCDLGNKKNSLRLDDWVLCRIYKKSNHRPMDHDREDSMDDMLGSIPPSISVGNGKLHVPMKGTGYDTLLEPEHNLFENMFGSTTGDGINTGSISHQLASSSSSKLELPLVPLKRTLSSLYWPEEEPAGASRSKKFHGDGGDLSIDKADHGTSSMATLLSQLQQNPPPLQSQAVLGSIGDGIFRPPCQLPGLNWYT